MADFNAEMFLGRPVGFWILFNDITIVDQAIQRGTVLLSSMLASWQRLYAVRTFVFPALNFMMRYGNLGKDDWHRLDVVLRPLLKKTLYLPANASNEYIYGSPHLGAAAIPLATELSDICGVDNAFKLLTSGDLELRDMASEGLREVVSKRLHQLAERPDVEDYLSGYTEGDFKARASQLRSIWTEAWKASRRLDVYTGSSTRTEFGSPAVITLSTLNTTGKVLQCVAADPASSHFMHSGSFTQFADWRIIHKVMLSLLPLNGACMWVMAERDQRCRVCGYARETLPHVLSHCMPQSAQYTARHNHIVARIRTACRGWFSIIIYDNRPTGDTNLHPDIALELGEETVSIDACCPFDNRLQAFTEARRVKVAKYKPVRLHLARRYQHMTVHVHTVIVGALGY
ncbi:uncharacterized protein LOC125941589 [Dermacentor silvarum]|uniref:uncharacterized protein LOC125941589 n=1 Tax=Dermacentor silvarum TaxID=543639 RepID=UPI0021006E06|nr:uncharacterized protein LOC125941589 [Dermacentor silvarum]